MLVKLVKCGVLIFFDCRYLERTKTMGNGCFKCGGSGHISRECGGGGGGRSGGGGGFGMGALQTSFMPDDGRFGKGLDRALRKS